MSSIQSQTQSPQLPVGLAPKTTIQVDPVVPDPELIPVDRDDYQLSHAAPKNLPSSKAAPPGGLTVADLQPRNSVLTDRGWAPKIPQQPTLEDERAAKAKFESPFIGLDSMSAKELFDKTPAQRKQWYQDKLGPYEAQVRQSAENHGIPPQLLATVVLNEMADINALDLVQEAWDSEGGSVGPAQIQVDTAVNHGLVTVPKSVSSSDRPGYVSDRLQIPQVAVEAAAGEVSVILKSMSARPGSSWQKSHAFQGFTPTPGNLSNDAYNAIEVPKNLNANDKRELQRVVLADAVIAAYNSPDIVVAKNPGTTFIFNKGTAEQPYPNGRNHGFNGGKIAQDLFKMKLFGLQ